MTMIVIDTNVVSELMKSAPASSVLAWVDEAPASSVFITTVTQAEIHYGIALLSEGKRRDSLVFAARAAFDHFRGRILPFDSAAAEAFAILAAGRRQSGRPIAQPDAQIAAIARSHGAILATWNAPDFEACGVKVVNPWNCGQ